MSHHHHQYETMKVGFAAPGVYHIQFHNGDKNFVDQRFWTEYATIFHKIPTSGDIRVVIISSSVPGYFCGGLDVAHQGKESFAPKGSDAARRAFNFRESIREVQEVFSSPERCRVPVICALHGKCVGLALDIALACDMRYAAKDAVLSMKEVDIAIAAGTGTNARLQKTTGSSSMATELAYTARDFTAQEAFQFGFVSRLVDGSHKEVFEEALKVAKVIASKSPVAVATTKRLQLHARDNTVDSNLEYTQVSSSAALQTDDIESAVKYYLGIGPEPTFKPLNG